MYELVWAPVTMACVESKNGCKMAVRLSPVEPPVQPWKKSYSLLWLKVLLILKISPPGIKSCQIYLN